VMRMSEGLDEGPILLSETVPIEGGDTAATLHDKLALAGAGLLPRALAALERGGAVETPQAPGGVIYAHKISSAEARIDWSEPAAVVDRKIRGLSPFPGAWFERVGPKGPVRVKVLLSSPALGSGQPGTVLDDALTVACGDGAVRLVRLLREGRGPQAADEFLRGTAIRAGERLA
jgi:methionyl-tRNA formyltransferase